MQPQRLPVNRNSQPTLTTNISFPFQPQSNAYPYRLPATGTQQAAAIASGLSGSEIRTGIRGRQTLNPFAPPYTPVRHNQPWYYYSTPQRVPSMIPGSEIRTGIRGRQTLNPFAPPYTPVRHNQPWYYYSTPQQSFPRPIPAMLNSTPSNLPTEFQEHQWNLPAGNLNHSEDPQSQRSDQIWRNQP
ncbi:hypothetical protein DsansV1_C23g0175331 [Dioscorea sansibarensis]